MRIFLICQQSKRNHPVPGYQFWEAYFKKGIEEAGHEWVEVESVDWAEGLVYSDEEDLIKWRQRSWNLAIEAIKQQHQVNKIDFFLSYLFPNQVEPAAIREIQALGIPCVNFFCDNVREFMQVPKEFYCFDLNWVPEVKAFKMYQQAKLNYIYAPMPVWIPPEQRTCGHSEKYGVSFIGSRDVQREALLAEVLKLGMSVEIRGAGWSESDSANYNFVPKNQSLWHKVIKNQVDSIEKNGILGYLGKISSKFSSKIPHSYFQEYVRAKPNPQEYVDIIQQSLISLGINRYPSYRYLFSRPDTYSRMRDVEAPMMGACYLTEWTDGLEDLFELGEEIETYRTAEEMVEKIRELEANPLKRKKMRCLAQKRALTEHTVAKSLIKITDFLGL